MSATLIKEENCRACGVDIREGALFCYNCGGSVTYEDAAAGENEAISDAWFREEIAEEVPEEKTSTVETAETKNDAIKKPGMHGTAKLRSAAALRRKTKNFQKKKVEEVVWEEYENASNGWFVLVAIGLTVISAAIFLLAIYLK
jgi:uncharacterized Zn finger protein (UPF0148 family)